MKRFKGFFLFLIPLFSLSAESSLDITSDWGYQNGLIREIVYQTSGDGYLSELLWDLENVFWEGGTVSLTQDTTRISFSCAFPISLGTGIMLDYDWLDGYPDDPDADPYDYNTHYSKSNIELIRGIQASLEYGRTLSGFLDNWSWFTALALEYYDFEDEIVEADYPSGWVKPDEGVNAIDYEATYLDLRLGVRFSEEWQRLAFSGAFWATPLTVNKTWDHHILTGFFYRDSVLGALKIGGDINFAYHLTDSFFFYAGAKGYWLFEESGDSYFYYESSADSDEPGASAGDDPDSIGMQASYWQITLGLGYSFKFGK